MRSQPRWSAGPTARELAAIEREWPLITAELALLDAEIAVLTAGAAVSPLERHRMRRVDHRVNREAARPESLRRTA